MFVPGKLFQSSPMFAGKARAYPSGAPERLHTGLPRKHWTGLEKLARDKHSSLLGKSVNYGRNEFYRTGPCFQKLTNGGKGRMLLLTNTLAYYTRV